MAWTSDQCYLAGLDHFTSCVHALGPDDWDRPTPCAGWTARDVVGHVGGATRFGTQLLTGQPVTMPPTEQPGSTVDGDPVAWWDALVGPSRAALDGVDLAKVVDSPMGPRSIADGLRFPAIDLFIHGWDLVRSTGHSVEIPTQVIEFAETAFAEFPEAAMRNARVFAPAYAADATATPSDALLAWTGRDPSWAPPAS
jgi:uncharacterized protein (TIGR03086 family)